MVPTFQNDSATLVLNGQILLPDFSRAVAGFDRIVSDLNSDFAKGHSIEWAMDGLDSSKADAKDGRALATARGLWKSEEDLAAVESVVEAYERFGSAMQNPLEMQHFSMSLQKAGKDLRAILNGHVKSFRFETARTDIDVYAIEAPSSDGARIEAPVKGPLFIQQESYGAIRGRIESLSRRQGLRFTLYDANDDLPVSCYLAAGQEAKLRDAWGRVAIVEGLLRREPVSGRPTTIREITEIRVLPELDKWDFARARGATGWKPGDMPAEKAIRLVRDG